MAYEIKVYRPGDSQVFKLRRDNSMSALAALAKIGLAKNQHYGSYGKLELIDNGDHEGDSICGSIDVMLHMDHKSEHIFTIDVSMCD